MKTLRIILIVLLVLFGIFLIWSYTLPSQYQVSRSISIEAPKEAVFAEVADFKKWEQWSPWRANDSTMSFEYGETTTGVGGNYRWTSENSGSGNMEFTEVSASDSLKTAINFIGMGNSNGRWTFADNASGQTEVEWSFSGELGFWQRFQGAIMDAAVGPMFEQGLEALKKVVENQQTQNEQKAESAYSIQEIQLDSNLLYGIYVEINMDSLNSSVYAEAYRKISSYLGKEMENSTGAPLAIFDKWDVQSKECEMFIAIPVDSELPETEEIKRRQSYSGAALLIDYYGDYEKTELAHQAMEKHLKAKQLEMAASPIEVYVDDPGNFEDQSKVLTKIIYPVLN
jgi:effector-binding domain-containing protein/carbon monoxide dehydrogenase subunit G